MTIKKLTAIIMISVCLLALAACGGASSGNSPSNDAKPSTGAGDTNKTSTENSASGPATPMAAAEAMFNVLNKKDVEGLKNMLSKKTMTEFEASSKRANQPLDKYIADVMELVQVPETFEARNEKITGDKATVEMMDKSGKWLPNKFIKEDGVWKIDLA